MINRARVAEILEGSKFGNFIMGVIILNAITLGLETSKTAVAYAGTLIQIVDQSCLAIFVIELVAKLLVFRMSFFRSGWNIFDFIIVGIALAPGTEGLSVLRALRILRVLRAQPAPRGRRFCDRPAGYGQCFRPDGDDFLYWRCDGHQTVWPRFP
jgi:voltage-gated sodium channel